MNWIYNKKEVKTIDDIIELSGLKKPYGFIYMIINKETGKYYVGKKSINKGVKWQNYFGSSIDLKDDIKIYGKESFVRKILTFRSNSKMLTYSEMYYQMMYNVLKDENSYNKNIAGKFYRKDFR